MYLCVLVAQSCLTHCDLMDYSPLGSSVHGILQQEYWSGLPFLSQLVSVYINILSTSISKPTVVSLSTV